MYEILQYIFQAFMLDEFECCCVEQGVRAELFPEAVGENSRVPEILTVSRLLESYGKDMEVSRVWKYFDSGNTLMKYFFVFEDHGPLLFRELRLCSRVAWWAAGKAKTFPEYGEGMRLCLPKSHGERKESAGNISEHDGESAGAEEALVSFVKSRPKQASWLIGLWGAKGSGRKYRVQKIFEALGKPLMIVDASVFENCGERGEECAGFWTGLRRQINKIVRECIFYRAGLMLVCTKTEKFSTAILKILFENFPVIFMSAPQKYIYSGRDLGFLSFWTEIAEPGYQEAAAVWRKALGGTLLDRQDIPEEMAGKFSMTPGEIFSAAALAENNALIRGQSILTGRDLSDACRELLAVHTGKKAIHVRPAFSWNELILPGYQKGQLEMLCRQIRLKNRVCDLWNMARGNVYGRGISVIFSGLPGTGKTMAAQVIARTLDMDLYKADLAAVVSKYIGETEKNLEEIFEQAGSSQAILFFDEADVLFSRRTEVKNSNDKYSNMEAAYMLQKIEAYDGITILSTNYLQNFDDAFRRRMRMIIDFPFPDEAHRKLLWSQVYPENVAVAADVDFGYLAKQFEFSGSNIKNAATFAAFIALDENRPVSMKDLAAGIKNEYSKLGKVLRPEDTGEYYMFFQ